MLVKRHRILTLFVRGRAISLLTVKMKEIKMNFLKTMFWNLKTGNLRRLPYFFVSLMYLVGTIVSIGYFAKTVFMPPRGSAIVIVAMLFFTYILFVLTTKRLRHLGHKRPILMSAFLSWTGFVSLVSVFLFNRFMTDTVTTNVIGSSVLFVSCVWLALMILFIPLLWFARENFFKLGILKLFFGDLSQGQLQRIPFLGCALYLNFLIYGGLLLFVTLLGAILFGGNQLLQLTMTHESLSALSSSFFLGGESVLLYVSIAFSFLCFYGLIFYVLFVLIIKRMRNIGVKHPISIFVLLFIGMVILLPILSVALKMPALLIILGLFVSCSVLALYFLPQGFIQQKPLKVLFADIKGGSLRRVAFFGYVVLAFCFAGLFLVGNLTSFDMSAGPNIWSIPGTLLLLYMAFVLTVKRLRHINFKRPVAIALILVVSDLTYYGISYSDYELADSLRIVWTCADVIIFLFLLFTPGNLFKRNGNSEMLQPASS